MQKRLSEINTELAKKGFARLAVGIGLHADEANTNFVRSEKRLEYTAIGDTINLAACLESIACAEQILIGKATAQAAGKDFPAASEIRSNCQKLGQAVPLFEVRWKQNDL